MKNNDNTDETKQKKLLTDFLSFSKSNKFKMLLAICLGVVVVVIFASSLKSNDKQNDSDNVVPVVASYAENTENRLKKILSSLDGVSNVNVFVYVLSSEEIVYKEDVDETIQSSGQSSTKKTTVFNKNGTSSSAVVVVTKYPKIEGILIVAHFHEDARIKLKIIDAVSCVLSIASSHIEVLEGKSWWKFCFLRREGKCLQERKKL